MVAPVESREVILLKVIEVFSCAQFATIISVPLSRGCTRSTCLSAAIHWQIGGLDYWAVTDAFSRRSGRFGVEHQGRDVDDRVGRRQGTGLL